MSVLLFNWLAVLGWRKTASRLFMPSLVIPGVRVPWRKIQYGTSFLQRNWFSWYFCAVPFLNSIQENTFTSSSEARSFTKPRWPLVHVTSFVPPLALIWLWFLFLPLPTFPNCQAVTWNCMQALGALEQAPCISKIFIPPNSLSLAQWLSPFPSQWKSDLWYT